MNRRLMLTTERFSETTIQRSPQAIFNSLTIESADLPAKAIALVRRATGLSVSEIRESARKGVPVLEAPLSDDDSLAKMISLHHDLAELNIPSFFQQAGRRVDSQFMENVLEAHKDTARELGLA